MFFLTRGISFLAASVFAFGVLQNERSIFLRGCLVEALVLEVLCLFLGGFLLDEIEVPGLLLEVLIGELRLGLTFSLESVALLGGVACILSMVRAINLGRTLEAFLTTITLGLGALLTPRLVFLVRGHNLRRGDCVGGLCTLTVLNKGCKT